MSKRIRSTGGQAGDTTIIIENPGDAGFTDDWAIAIQADDINANPTDDATFEIEYEVADSNAGQEEAVELKFPVGVWGENNPAPTESQSLRVDVWLANSAGSGTASPGNADGQNDGGSATVQTAALGANTETLLSDIGTSTGAWNFTSCLYRGWFSMSTVLATSNCNLIATSSTAAFADIVMLTHAPALGGSINHLGGDFTFDLFAAGVDTIAKLNSLQIIHRTADVAAGVTPASISVDAGRVELEGVFDTPSVGNELTIADEIVNESAGTVTITVTRTNPSGNTDVDYDTAAPPNVSGEPPAVAAEDYTTTSGTLNFVGAETSKTFTVPIIGNTYPEVDRKFAVNISGVVNGSILDAQGLVTIQDDDGAFTFLQDVSGNGHDLVVGTVASTSRDCSVNKFGKGRAVSATGSSFLLQDDAFNITGDLSLTLVIDLDSLPAIGDRRNLVGFTDVASGTGDWGCVLT